MRARTSLLHLLTSMALLLGTAPAARADGVPVGPVPGEAQSRPVVGADGRGGATVSYKTAALQVGSVHVGAQGVPDGKLDLAPATPPFAIEANEPLRALVPSDSEIVWISDRAASGAPVATRLRADGTTATGFPVALPMPLRHAVVVPGLGGRMLLIAKDSDAVSYWTLRAAIVGANGMLESSVQLSSTLQFFMADALDACTDGAGGLLAAMPFYDAAATGSKDLAIFRLASDGSRPWGDSARPVVVAANDQTDVHVAPDGQGGMIMVWTDPRAVARSTDIFALRIDHDGQRVPGWPYYGSPVCDAMGPQSQPRVTRDGLGGVWVVWLDQRSEPAGDLRYTHLLGNAAFAPGFTSDGAVLCDAPGAQAEAALVGDGGGGFFAVWRDDRSGTSDLYVQHVSATGAVAAGWAANGRLLTNAPGVQDQPAIAAVSGAHAVVAWRDARAGTTRIYAAGIEDLSMTDAAPGPAHGLRLVAARANGGEPRVRVTLPHEGSATLELLDLAGRAVARTRLQGPLDEHEAGVEGARSCAPGLYFARLRQAGAQAIARLTVVR